MQLLFEKADLRNTTIDRTYPSSNELFRCLKVSTKGWVKLLNPFRHRLTPLIAAWHSIKPISISELPLKIGMGLEIPRYPHSYFVPHCINSFISPFRLALL